MPEVVVGTLNLHAGVDGWARPFDPLVPCRRIDADVLVIEENWSPDSGPSLAARVAAELGYELTEVPMARGCLLTSRVADQAAGGPSTWGPGHSPGRSGSPRAIRLAGPPSSARRRAGAAERGRPSLPGAWGVAVLSRLPVLGHEVLELTALAKDPARRVAILVEVAVGGRRLLVAGTHLGHLRHGSLRQMRALATGLRDVEGPAVLLGDLNCWGPPVLVMMPGWRRAARGRTWPAWWPHSQLDHVLVKGGVRRLASEIMPASGSDHRGVRARLRL